MASKSIELWLLNRVKMSLKLCLKEIIELTFMSINI